MTRQFEITRIQRLNPGEYRRQAEILAPLKGEHSGLIVTCGLAEAMTLERPDIKPLPLINEGSRFAPIRNTWGKLETYYRNFFESHFDTEFDQDDTVFYIEREDIKMQSSSFRWGQEFLSEVGVVRDEGLSHVVAGISMDQLTVVQTCITALAAAREEYGLTMLDPVTLEEVWSVPDAPRNWKPVDW